MVNHDYRYGYVVLEQKKEDGVHTHHIGFREINYLWAEMCFYKNEEDEKADQPRYIKVDLLRMVNELECKKVVFYSNNMPKNVKNVMLMLAERGVNVQLEKCPVKYKKYIRN